MARIEWIILVTNDFKKSSDFYTLKLGLPVFKIVPTEEFVQYQLENCYLAIYGSKHVQKLLGIKQLPKPGSVILTFQQSVNIDETYEDLKSKGIHFMTKPVTQAWGQRTAYFTDPDGYIWEIQQWLKQNK